MIRFKSQHLGLPLSFTTYSIEGDTLYIRKGFLRMTIEMVKLYSIRDMSLEVGLLDALFKQGNIVIYSNDLTTSKVVLERIGNPEEMLHTLDKLIVKERRNNGFSVREIDTSTIN